MKLKLHLFSIVTCLFIITSSIAQNKISLDNNGLIKKTDVNLSSENLVSDYTFNNLVFQDLNFLILGENSPSQGLSSTLNETGSEFTLSGLVKSFNSSFITAEGAFSATNGAYFIDDNGGSKSSKFSLNYFQSFKGSRKYNLVRADDDVKRALIISELEKQNVIRDLVYDYEMITFIMTKANIPYNINKSKDVLDNFKSAINKFNYEIETNLKHNEQISKFISLKKIDGSKTGYNNFSIDNTQVSPFKPKVATIQVKDASKTVSEFSGNIFSTLNNEDNQDRNTSNYKIKGSLNSNSSNSVETSKDILVDPIKLAKLYDETLNKMDSVGTSLSKKELSIAAPHWNSKQLWYWGINANYERERLTTYNYQDNVSFNELFNDQDGNLFSFGAQLAFYWQGSQKSYDNTNTIKQKSKIFYAILKGSLGQGSNLSVFQESTFITSPTVVNMLGEDAITTQNSKKAFSSTSEYSDEGFNKNISAELYWFPINGYGIFGQLGYTGLNFDSGISGDKDRYNLRAGLLFNLKNKDKLKNIFTLQLFADRSDLELAPNGDDANLKFGVKIGLPININSAL